MPTTTVARAPTPRDWRAFAKSLTGRLVRPSSAGYELDVRSYNPIFDQARPMGLAYCASADDVALAIDFAQSHAVELSVRSGGHCYGGWSTGPGLVIDVSPMNQVDYVPATGIVSVGSGTRLIDLYAGLAPYNRAVPGGSCPSVGIAGLSLGGGFGVLGRKFGLTCDNLESAEVVLASGETVSCNSQQHSDLFWALRGGGGGSFGVVTSFGFLTHPIGTLGLFTLVWPWSNAAAVASVWQAWAPQSPDELWSNCLLVASQSTPAGEAPAARVTGVYVGPQSGLQSLVDEFVTEVGASPFTNFVGSAPYLDAMQIEGGCEGDTIAECHLRADNPNGLLRARPVRGQVKHRQPSPVRPGHRDAASGRGATSSVTCALRRRLHSRCGRRGDQPRRPGCHRLCPPAIARHPAVQRWLGRPVSKLGRGGEPSMDRSVLAVDAALRIEWGVFELCRS